VAAAASDGWQAEGPTVSPDAACEAPAVGLAAQVGLVLLGQGSGDHAWYGCMVALRPLWAACLGR
jgi:hypothetical protein